MVHIIEGLQHKNSGRSDRKDLRLGVDRTANHFGCYVANGIVGTLGKAESSPIYLVQLNLFEHRSQLRTCHYHPVVPLDHI